jgi:hypothetical protein
MNHFQIIGSVSGSANSTVCGPSWWYDNYRIGREMTAADLGLPLGQWAIEWLRDAYGPCHRWEAFLSPALPPPLRREFILGRWTDAPYAFWLGADA